MTKAFREWEWQCPVWSPASWRVDSLTSGHTCLLAGDCWWRQNQRRNGYYSYNILLAWSCDGFWHDLPSCCRQSDSTKKLSKHSATWGHLPHRYKWQCCSCSAWGDVGSLGSRSISQNQQLHFQRKISLIFAVTHANVWWQCFPKFSKDVVKPNF